MDENYRWATLLEGTHVHHEGQRLSGQSLAALRIQQVIQAAQVLLALLYLRQLGVSALLRLHHLSLSLLNFFTQR